MNQKNKEKKFLKEKVQNDESETVLVKKGEEGKRRQVIRSITGRIMPITFLKGDKKLRRTIYLKEALIFSVFLTVLDFIAFYKLSYFDMLHLIRHLLVNDCFHRILSLLHSFLLLHLF